MVRPQTRWAAIDQLVNAFNQDIRFGLVTYSGCVPGQECSAGKIVVPLGNQNAGPITGFLGGKNLDYLCNSGKPETSTGNTLYALIGEDSLQDPERGNAVLLITDGGENDECKTVTDGADSDTGLVAVTVTSVNDGPLASDDTASTAEDTAATITAASLLANDTDVDGGALTVTAVGGAVNGTVALAGGTVTFTPTANASGTGSFTYTVSDGAATATGTVTVTITAVNDPPVAVADTATTAEDTPLAITAASLTANDTDVDTGATLTVTAVSGATNGTVALAGTTITFTPTANFNGTAGIVRISTDIGATTPVNDAFASLGLDVSADGARMAYGINGGNARVYTIATDTETTLARPCQAIRFAPDGSRVGGLHSSPGASAPKRTASSSHTRSIASGVSSRSSPATRARSSTSNSRR